MKNDKKVVCKFCEFEFKTYGQKRNKIWSAERNLEKHIIHCMNNPNRIYYECDKCQRKFDTRFSINGHKAHCYKERPIEYKKKIIKKKNKIKKCPYCEYKNDNHFKLAGHIGSCKLNPNYNNRIENIRKYATGKIISDKSREKISKARIKYLSENPDKVPYLINHSSKESYSEKLFREALIESKVFGWVQEYRNGIYSYDFAFPDHKLDIEIDGGTHRSTKVMKIDERRDKWSSDQGWRVIRFTDKQIKSDMKSCIEKIIFNIQTIKVFNNCL